MHMTFTDIYSQRIGKCLKGIFFAMFFLLFHAPAWTYYAIVMFVAGFLYISKCLYISFEAKCLHCLNKDLQININLQQYTQSESNIFSNHGTLLRRLTRSKFMAKASSLQNMSWLWRKHSSCDQALHSVRFLQATLEIDD